MHVRMNQLVQDAPPPAQETTTETQGPGREPAARPHHTARVSGLSRHGTFLLFYCGVSGGHCIDVFV